MTEIPQKEKKVEVITANSNPRIKELNKLNKDAKLRKDRDVFVVEGIRMFRELPLQNVQEVYLSESALKEYRDEFKSMGVLDGRNTWILSDGVFAGVSQTKTPQGCMAVVKCMHYQLDSVLGRNDRETFLVLDTLQKRRGSRCDRRAYRKRFMRSVQSEGSQIDDGCHIQGAICHVR